VFSFFSKFNDPIHKIFTSERGESCVLGGGSDRKRKEEKSL